LPKKQGLIGNKVVQMCWKRLEGEILLLQAFCLSSVMLYFQAFFHLIENQPINDNRTI